MGSPLSGLLAWCCTYPAAASAVKGICLGVQLRGLARCGREATLASPCCLNGHSDTGPALLAMQRREHGEALLRAAGCSANLTGFLNTGHALLAMQQRDHGRNVAVWSRWLGKPNRSPQLLACSLSLQRSGVTMGETLRRLGPTLELTPMQQSAFVKPHSIMFQLDGEAAVYCSK